MRNKTILNQNLAKLCKLSYGQCTDQMKAILSEEETFKDIEKKMDVVGLLKLIKAICHKFNANNHATNSVIDALIRTFGYRQTEGQETLSCIEELKARYEVIEELIGNELVSSDGKAYNKLTNMALDSLPNNKQNMADVNGWLSDHLQASLAIKNADPKRFNQLKADLKSLYLKGTDEYPTTLPAALKLLQNYA